MTVTTSVPKAPRPDTRELRALALYRERGAEIVRTGPWTYTVPSCTGTGFWAVNYRAESCDCPDARLHPGLNCKHVLAVAVKRAKRRGQSARNARRRRGGGPRKAGPGRARWPDPGPARIAFRSSCFSPL